MASAPLQITFEGFIKSTMDALMIFEACLNGTLRHAARRPHDRERQELIRSGSVFVYEENSSGIKRWTDGVTWSPSRILQNFLVYRELTQPFPPGQKKQAMKRTKKPQTGITKAYNNQRSRATSFSNMPNGAGFDTGAGFNTGAGFDAGAGLDAGELGDDTRELVGSLIDSYDFKATGLVKKTISITYNGIQHHLVSYYTVDDIKAGRLMRPCDHPAVRKVFPREDLISSQNFRVPIHDELVGEEERQFLHSREAIIPRDQFYTTASYPVNYQHQHQPIYQYFPQHYDTAPLPNAPTLPNGHTLPHGHTLPNGHTLPHGHQPQGFGVEHQQHIYAPQPPQPPQPPHNPNNNNNNNNNNPYGGPPPPPGSSFPGSNNYNPHNGFM
ncbi:Global transcription regulator sge1 [Fusarium poae]|uniref:hypothetical protein n=1 Tax=Fusarium poae TaxID=36050 RepID=UPI001CEAF402|nr:hypothetical protein FPOAC1_002718 [Fusarium poae]KAG8676711.1 hypothetical protein FPOAC1_002718 [Fusarium poae]